MVNSLIKHPRYHYYDQKLKGFFSVDGEMFCAEEFVVPYQQGINLIMSVMTRLTENETGSSRENRKSLFPRPAGQRNCLLYLHTHQGCRIEGTYLVDLMVNYESSLAVIDFAGAGMSGGEYTSFGWYESEQVNSVVNFLSSRLGFESIGIWGKSMGGAAAILYYSQFRSPLVKFLVVDSSFDKAKHAILNIASSHSKAPTFAIKAFLMFVASTVKSKAKFDIYKVRPIDHVANITVPCIFVIGQEDEVVKTTEFFNLHAKCGAPYKKLFVAKGDHTANRLDDDDFRHEMIDFIGHFFPMRRRAEEINGVLKNKSMIPLVRSRMSHGPDSQIFDHTKLKNSIFMPRNDGMRQHTISDSHLQPHVSALQHPLQSHLGDSNPQLLVAQHHGPTLQTPSPLQWNYGGAQMQRTNSAVNASNQTPGT